MTSRPRRRTLAERDAQAINNPPIPAPDHSRKPARTSGTTSAKRTRTTSTTNTTKSKEAPKRRGAPPTVRTDMNIWIDRTLWRQAKTLYLRAHPGHEVALVEWVEEIVNGYLDKLTIDVDTPMGDEGYITKITLTPATKQRIIATVEKHSLRGRAISRSAVISAALSRAVSNAGGSDVPAYQGRLPRGRRPRS